MANLKFMCLASGTLLVSVSGAMAQTSQYRVGDKVELNANGEHWQKCTVTDPGSQYRVMRLQCEAYEGPGYSRHAGIFVESYNSTAVRRAAPPAGAAARANPGGTPPPSQGAPPRRPTAAAPASGGGYRVGQQVELEASGHWVPCTVSDIQNYAGLEPLIRVQCPAYPALSRAAGTYIVHNNVTGIRPATGRIGPAPKPAAPVRNTPGPGNSLRVGEYACYGVGNQIMAGLKFNITGPGRYVDAYGTAGTYSINGTNVSFRGGALGGMTGRDLKTDNSFNLGIGAVCQLWS